MFRPVILSLLFLGVFLAATARSEAPNGPTEIPNPVKMFRTTMKSWRTVYKNYKEEMDLGYCWADYFFDVRSFINTLTGPKILGPNRVAVASLKALLRNWLNEPAPPKPSPPTWYEKIFQDSPLVPTTTEPAFQGFNGPQTKRPAEIEGTQKNPEDNSYSGDVDESDEAYSDEEYGNEDRRPIPYTYLNPTQIQQPTDQGQPTPLAENQLLPQGQAQLFPQGQTQLLPQGQTQLLPQGQAQLLPQGQTQLLPQGQAQLLPQGQAQLLPQGQAELLPQALAQHSPRGQGPLLPQGQVQFSPNQNGGQLPGRGELVQGRPVYPRYIYPGITADSPPRNPLDGYKRGFVRQSVIGSSVNETRNEIKPDNRDVEDPGMGRSLANGLTLRSNVAEARGLGDLFVSTLGFNTPPGVGALRFNVEPSPALIVFARIVGTFFRIGRQFMDTIEGTSILACSKNYLSVKFFRWIDTA